MESKNVAFNSCLCMEGSAFGIVYATGDNTLIGFIDRLTAAPRTGNTILYNRTIYFKNWSWSFC